MSGDLFFGFDNTKPEEEQKTYSVYVNSRAFNSFDLFFDAALTNYPKILANVKRLEDLAMYDFIDLNAKDYNVAIKAIRHYIASIQEPNLWQKIAIEIWNEDAETFIYKDKRYDETY